VDGGPNHRNKPAVAEVGMEKKGTQEKEGIECK